MKRVHWLVFCLARKPISFVDISSFVIPSMPSEFVSVIYWQLKVCASPTSRATFIKTSHWSQQLLVFQCLLAMLSSFPWMGVKTATEQWTVSLYLNIIPMFDIHCVSYPLHVQIQRVFSLAQLSLFLNLHDLILLVPKYQKRWYVCSVLFFFCVW